MPAKLRKALAASARKKGYIPGSKKYELYVNGNAEKIEEKIRRKIKREKGELVISAGARG